MFIIYKCRDYDGELMYNCNSILGCYEKYNDAKKDLINKLTKLKYTFDIEHDDETYFFATISPKSDKKRDSGCIYCYEIIEKKMNFNTLKFK